MSQLSSDNKVTVAKTLRPEFARIGDIVTNIMTVTVPKGTYVYNFQVACDYPSASQLYQDHATLDGLPISPAVLPGTVTFPIVNLITSSDSDVHLVYTFDILVIDETHAPLSLDYQNGNNTVTWEPSPGVAATSKSVTCPLRYFAKKLYTRKTCPTFQST